MGTGYRERVIVAIAVLATAGVLGGVAGGKNVSADLVLEGAILPGGYATGRWLLSSGDVLQMHSGCNEWASGGTGFIVRRDWSTGDLRVVTFDAGPAAEVHGHLLVASSHQFGSDGTEGPFHPPQGARASCYDHTGSLLARRVVAVDLETGAVKRAPWDSWAPATSGTGRHVVLAVMEPGQGARCADVEASGYLLWDLERDEVTELGSTDESPSFRIRGDDVLMRVRDGEGWRILAVDGTDGTVREAPSGWSGPASDGIAWLAEPVLHGDVPPAWITNSGTRILAPAGGPGSAPSPPSFGGCGVPGPAWSHGLLFTDDGAYEWPDGLKLSP